MKNIKIGKMGEIIAEKYLIKNGYLILAKNHNERFYEIDIVARDNNGILVFCEVKTCTNNSQFRPEDNLTPNKYRKLIHASELFIARNPAMIRNNIGWRIDLIAISLWEENSGTLQHYKNI